MKRVCTHCERISTDGNMWCQNRDCPSGTLTVVFDYGEGLGDLEIVRLLRVYRMSALYEAKRGNQLVLLKVAHNGCQEQLRMEAMALAKLLETQQHPMLPVLLPAYQYAEGKQRPYGKTVFQDETKYYIVFQHAQGDFLRDMLIRNPQPWYLHAAWLSISLADALAFLHVKGGKLHLNINPDHVMVRTDKQGIPRPLLLDLGMVAEPSAVNQAWIKEYALPAYTPPELLDKGGQASVASDVYGLGLLLYEMLAGHPAFKFKLQKDDDVRHAVRTTNPPPLNRTDLAEDIAGIIYQAIDKVPARRQPDIRTFAKQLRVKFGEVPVEKKGRQLDRRAVAVGVFAALAVVVYVVLAAALQNVLPAVQ
jgi:serine/threonine protein kinase